MQQRRESFFKGLNERILNIKLILIFIIFSFSLLSQLALASDASASNKWGGVDKDGESSVFFIPIENRIGIWACLYKDNFYFDNIIVDSKDGEAVEVLAGLQTISGRALNALGSGVPVLHTSAGGKRRCLVFQIAADSYLDEVLKPAITGGGTVFVTLKNSRWYSTFELHKDNSLTSDAFDIFIKYLTETNR